MPATAIKNIEDTLCRRMMNPKLELDTYVKILDPYTRSSVRKAYSDHPKDQQGFQKDIETLISRIENQIQNSIVLQNDIRYTHLTMEKTLILLVEEKILTLFYKEGPRKEGLPKERR